MSRIRAKAERKIDRQIKTGKFDRLIIKTIDTPVAKELDRDVVPVRVDAKTVIMVDRRKCEFVDGKWKKKA